MIATPFLAGLTAASTISADAYAEWMPFQPDRPAAWLEERYTDEASQFVEVDGARIHYRDEGPAEAPTLVAVHGVYSSLHTWDEWVDRLRDRVRVVRLTLPGFGLTGPRDGEHSLAALVDTLAAFCDRLGLANVAFAGNSLGGSLAWRLAVDRPDLVSKLLLLDAGGQTILTREAAAMTRPGPSVVPRFFTPRSAVRLILRDGYGDPAKVTPQLVRRYHDLLLRTGNRRAVIELARSARENGAAVSANGDEPPQTGAQPDPSEVSVPTLVQWGSEDDWLPVGYGRRLADAIPDATFRTYEGVGHVPMEEAPGVTSREAVLFLLGSSTPGLPHQ